VTLKLNIGTMSKFVVYINIDFFARNLVSVGSVTTCRGHGILWRPHCSPHSLFYLCTVSFSQKNNLSYLFVSRAYFPYLQVVGRPPPRYAPPLFTPWASKCFAPPNRRQRSSSFPRPTRSHAHCSRLTRQHGGEQSSLVTLTF